MKKVFVSIGVVVGLVVIFVVYHFFFSPIGYIMNGPSMSPTYSAGTKLMVSQDLSTISRGSVVVFSYTASNGKSTELIKRIIGLPSEKVDIKVGKIYINNVATDVQPISIVTDSVVNHTQGTSTNLSAQLGGDEYFVLGDNTQQSLDSRQFGAIKKSAITWLVTGTY